MKPCAVLLLCLSAITAFAGESSSEFVGVKPELICEAKTIVPGQTFAVALALKHVPGFHTYWENPGTVGFATNLEWELPEGFVAGAIQWQVPERCKMVGYNAHGYKGDTLLLVDITAPRSLPEGRIILKAKGGWMACGDKPGQCCNIGYKDFTLELQAGDREEWHEEVRAAIAKTRSKLPLPIDGWKHSCKRNGEKLVLETKRVATESLPDADEIYFYSRLNHINTLADQEVRVEGSGVSVTLPISEFAPKKIERLVGLLYHPDGWPGAGGRKYLPVDVKVDSTAR